MKINGILANYKTNLNVLNLQKSVSYKTKSVDFDRVNFGANKNKIIKPLEIDYNKSKKVINQLATSTSGLRAPYMSDVFNPNTIHLITLGVAQYAKNHNKSTNNPTVVIGGDTRKATRESLPQIADTLAKQGIDVVYIKDPIPTPMLAMTARKENSDISILMTASHNPWQDGGFNFITNEGAIAGNNMTKEISNYMDNIAKIGFYSENITPEGNIYEFNPYSLYKNSLEKLDLIDFDNIKNSNIKVYYDSLQGTGSYVMPKLLKDYGINFEEVHSKGQTGPQPTKENLNMLENKVAKAKDNLKIGLANDGDADRFGIIDENGNYIEPNDILLLTVYHLVENKGLKGDIVRSHATTAQLDEAAKKYGLKIHVTPVGFKYLASDILKARNEGRDIIVAGEESGGLTTYGNIPEKDGILADFLMLDLVAKENKPIGEILKEVKQKLDNTLYYDSYSIRIKDNKTKERILSKVEKRFNKALEGNTEFGEHRVDIEKTLQARDNILNYKENGDGYMFTMTDGSTVLIRKSGTEPLLRFYIEATGKNQKHAEENAKNLKGYINKEYIDNIK